MLGVLFEVFFLFGRLSYIRWIMMFGIIGSLYMFFIVGFILGKCENYNFYGFFLGFFIKVKEFYFDF